MFNVLKINSLIACTLGASVSGIADWVASMSHVQSALSWVSPKQQAVSMTKRSIVAVQQIVSIGLTLSLMAYSSLSLAVTPFGTAINNTATANYSVGVIPVTVGSNVNVVTTNGRTSAKIEYLQYDPSSTDVQNVNVTQCNGSPLPAPTFIGAGTAAAPIPLPNIGLSPASQYASGDAVFVRLTDLDQNLSATVIDTVTVTITTPTGDAETLTLSETGLSTGVFIGYIQSNSTIVAPNSCALNASSEMKATVQYTDINDVTDSVASISLWDPFGITFDTVTGLGVNGSLVKFIDTATNLPAAVYCDDGVTLLNQLPTGGVVTGNPTNCDPIAVQGGYRFPRAAIGTYRLEITPPTSYVGPSTIANATLQALPGAPYVLIVGSRGEPFLLEAGPPLEIDIPIDPPASGNALQISKTASKSVVGEGEFVPYSITIQNNGVGTTANVKISDTLPAGFRYAKNSAKVEGVSIAEPTISADGRTLIFSIGNIAGNATVTLKYVAEVTIGARAGQAENTARATSHSSNTGRATVTVREDLFRSRAILVGSVMACNCDELSDEDVQQGKFKMVGVKGIRIMLEDGTYIITDNEGQWHADNIRPGTHVVQLDVDSLGDTYEIINKGNNTRFAGRRYSQFVNLKAGTLWRADFYLRKIKASPEALDTQTVTTEEANFKTPIDSADNLKHDKALNNKRDQAIVKANVNPQLVEKLPYDTDWLATVASGAEWLHPQNTFQPALPAIKIAVKTVPGQIIALKVNGVIVNPLNYDGMIQNTAKTVALSTWRGVSINDGDNKLELVVTSTDGKEVLRETRNIHYSSGPVKAEFIAEKSHLVADGKSKPIVAIRFIDADGKPARRGVNGRYELNAPYESAQLLERLQRTKLSTNLEGKPIYEIGEDGIALIELAPTTQSGEVVMNFDFVQGINQIRKQEIRNWLEAGQRDWILVGFGQGTIGHKKLSGNVKALKSAGVDDELFDRDQLAFYAKGTVKGEYLITAAYDTAKQNGSAGARANLKQTIDPNRYYTLYADATQPYFDAASASKLYVKVERKQFYAMFGDFDTGLTVTEFSRYSRTLNGIKSEFKNEKFGYNAFATLGAQGYVRDEIRGEGVSGLYRLSRKNIIENTDKIRIDVRDRFQSQVIVSTKTLTRFLDYDIDYNLGTLFFKEPIMSRDANLNPTFIIAEYEANDRKDEKLSYGGRASYKPTNDTEIGATFVHEGNVGASGNLRGADIKVQIDDNTKIRGEIANSNKNVTGTSSNGNAYLAEVIRQDGKVDAKAYIRQQDEGFGLGQQAGSETGTRKIGAEGRYTINDTTRVQAQAYRQNTLSTDATRDVAEARVEQKINLLDIYYGGRFANDNDGAGLARDSKQAIAGVSYELLDRKLTLRAGTELGFSQSDSTDFPNRLRLGADYKLNEKTSVFAEHEFAWNDAYKANTSRIGTRVQPWTGGEAKASLGGEMLQDGNRAFASMGLTQKWQVNEQWQADFGLDRSQTIVGDNKNTSNGAVTNGTVNALNINVPLASGNAIGNNTGDFTAVSAGVNYTKDSLSANGRIEFRNADTEDKINLVMGAYRTLDKGRSMAAGILFTDTKSNTGIQNSKFDARLSYAQRPLNARWIMLDRFDFISEKQDDSLTKSRAVKLVNNLNVNYLPNRRTQLSLQYGAKYVFDAIDGKNYKGYTDLASAELRYDINSHWDIGAHGSMLNSYNSNVHQFGVGVSIGYRVMDNSWLSVGYNFKGFNDSDFSGAEYRAKGLYATIRVKFDQDSLKLNTNKKMFESKP